MVNYLGMREVTCLLQNDLSVLLEVTASDVEDWAHGEGPGMMSLQRKQLNTED